MAREAPSDAADGLEAGLARRLEAEAALIAASPAAAVSWAVAGLVGLAGGPRDVVLPVAHRVRLDGAPLDRLVALGGGTAVEVGTVGDCPEGELEAALERAAAGLLVVGCGAAEVLAPARFLWRCRQAGRPALILDPASGRWAAWADGGAALVVADGRAVADAPAGILAGTGAAIAACRAVEEAAAAFAAPEATRAALAAALGAGFASAAPPGARALG